ncbi:beta strand repeat-containing protein [Hymenobacter metallicola]|uniref:T9SS type A sorting domain-containing protein n=1 Tax=Hymenobacter metallicola TaxID=2563114 RepID=A0A4Z0QI28_9BACT|nr:FG-GAP-like repeat-containing protein [Hymenobacter metallicola]TGE29660.1 T9SS type A sorting domain-containing protein [Hymenobacter metallicola]
MKTFLRRNHLTLWLTMGLGSLLGSSTALAQTTLINETFEAGTFGAFTAVNGSATNQWVVGNAAGNGSSAGTQAAYISNNGSAYTYTVTGAASAVHLYRDVTFPAGQTAILLSFDWKAQGEADEDDLRVFLVPTTTTPTAGSQLSATPLATYGLKDGFLRTTLVVPASAAGTTQRLVFSWRKDTNGGVQPPAAIDNVLLTSKVAATLCGIKTVGPDAGTTYKTLGEALNDVNVSGLCGPLTLELQSNYLSSAEAFTPTYTYAGGSATNTVTVRPAAGATGLSLSGSALQTLNIYGGKYLVLDGRPGGSGASVSGAATAADLTVANTNTSGVVLQFANNASFNTIQHCQIQGVSTATTLANVQFSNLGATTTGNSDNTIHYNAIGSGATTPAVLVYSGSSTNSRNTISNNSLLNFYSTGDAYGLLLASAGNGWTISGNSLYQTTSRAAVTGTMYGIFVGDGNGHSITNNFIGGTAPGATGTALTITGAAAYRFSGIHLTPVAGTPTSVQGNTVANINWATSSSAATTYGVWSGIYSAGSGSTIAIGTTTGNTIGSSSGPIVVATSTTGANVFGISLGNSAAATLAKNTISSLSISGTTAATLNGIVAAAGTSNSITQNKVYNLSVSAGGASQVLGIRLTGGTTNTLSNNLIGDLRAPASTSLTALAGIQLEAGNNSLYYNTVYLAGTSSGATFGTSGIYLNTAQSTSTLNARNNIVVNKSTATGTGGYTAALRRISGTNGTAPANLAAETNNNLYYAGTPSARNLIYVEGTTTATNAQQTLAGYKALVAARESNSVTEDVAFVSTSGANAGFLHVSPLQTSLAENGGTPISGLTTDFDGDTRNASTPDIGADEFVTVPVITGLVPARNAINVPVNTNVSVTFAQTVTAATASGAQLRTFSAQRGGLLAGAYSGVGTTTATFNPTTDLKPGETVFTTSRAQGQNVEGAPIFRSQVYQFTAAAAGTGTGGYGSGSEVPVGTRPYHIAAADVDGDGDLDLLTANQNSNTVSVRLNDGSGAFTAGSSEVAVTTQPLGLAVGDVDGDGDLDILANSYDAGIVSVRLNNGSGSFTAGSSEVTTGAAGGCVILADLDGDGDLDLATANYINGAGNSLSVRFNNGLGTFSGGSEISVGNAPLQVVAGDIDNDGDLDLLSANVVGNSVSVRLNNGSGSFTNGQTLAVGSSPLSVALGDLDGNGTLDLLATSAGANNLSEFRNIGGTFGLTTTVAANADPEFVLTADVDADGDLDVLIANWQAGTVTVRYNNGNGFFFGNRVFAVGMGPETIVAADLDNDGDLDIMTGNYGLGTTAPNNTVSVRLNVPAGPLPVELVEFTARAQGNAVQLRWATATEKNNDYFAVERSTDAKTFTTVGTVPGHGTSSTGHRYTLTDTRLPVGVTKLYYRLRQVDTDASTSTSPVQVVAVSTDDATAFQVHPTTVTDGYLRYSCTGAAPAGAAVSVYTLTGQQVLRQRVGEASEGAIPVAGLQPGWYVVRYTTATATYTSRFSVQQ